MKCYLVLVKWKDNGEEGPFEYWGPLGVETTPYLAHLMLDQHIAKFGPIPFDSWRIKAVEYSEEDLA